KFSRVFSINSLHRSSRMEQPSRGGEKRTAVWASHQEERGSDDVVAPPVGDHRVVPHRWVVFARCTPVGQSRTPAMRLPHGCEGLRVRRMTVWWTFRRPCMDRPVPRPFLHNAWLDMTTTNQKDSRGSA